MALEKQNTDADAVIIGAGLAGLSAAYDIGKTGKRVTVLESGPDLGGLASSVIVGGRSIERFYHFICRGDSDLLGLVSELGLSKEVHWEPSVTSFFYQGKMYQFGTPFDLLSFDPVPFLQRIRFGLNVVESRYRKNWKPLDKRGAKQWLIEQIGPKAYEVIWEPLLAVKFGEYTDKISAAWIWHRINRVASSRRVIWEPENLGYLEHGSDTVINALADRISQMPNVTIRTGVRVERIETESGKVTGVSIIGESNKIVTITVISTIALNPLLKITPAFDESYRKQIQQIEYIGVVCGLLKLKQPITRAFWTNINDSIIPYNGIIEYTNLNKHLYRDLGNKSIAYIPYYIPTSHPRYSYTDDQLLKEFTDGIKRVNSSFDDTWIEEVQISRAPFAQAICTVGFDDIMPAHQTPIAGLYITDSTQFYPEDRSISAAIRLGRRVAAIVVSGGAHFG